MPKMDILSKGTLDSKAISRVARQADLDDIYLLDASIASDSSTREPRGSKLEYAINTKILKTEDNNFSVLVTFKISAIQKKHSENPILTIEAKFVLVYSCDKANKLLPENIEHFTKINSIKSAWPYWREFVQNMVGRMGFPTLTIPILKFKIKKIEKITKSKATKPKELKEKLS
ncbi:MAG: protein-export chaperone SecB [Desulfobaccales bacterium]